MKRYSNSKAKRIASGNKPTNEISEESEIPVLLQRRIDEAPESGSQLPSNGELRFDSLPISAKTLAGLHAAKLTITTEIQAAALPHALAGRDILGAAKTGSGKTLSFVIPLIERLYVERWGTDDGLAAVIITPTRELALQIFEVVRIVGKHHQFSAGLITGGKKEFEGEQERIINMNILVATPGRLLQHFEQTVGMDTSQLMVLVLDEADRILDMGFKQQLDAIVSYFPPGRQTMLFSATQTKSVKDLARLSLNNAEYVAVHAEDNEVTPKQLIQNYIVCKLPEKLDILFSFLKTHLKSKVIIFFSTCSQVRFVYECFRGMQPGIPLTALHGKIKQERRTIIYMDYVKRNAACLIATDIAARGLDFPNVDWVIQADAPEDAAMYIHRVGRTARYNSNGRALLLVTPNEEAGVVKDLEDANVPIKKLTVNPKKTVSVSAKAAALLAAQPEYRGFAKKAFTGYLRSIQMLPNNYSLDINSLPLDEFATSLGLGFTPPVPIVERGAAGREDVRSQKNVNRSLDKLKKQIKEAKELKKLEREKNKESKASKSSKSKAVESSDDEDLLSSKKKKDAKKTKETKKAKAAAKEESDDGEDDLLTVKQVHAWGPTPTSASTTAAVSSGKSVVASSAESEEALALKAKKAKKMKIDMDGEVKGVKERTGGLKKTVFDDEGNVVENSTRFKETATDLTEVDSRIADYASLVKQRVDKGRKEDLQREKQRIREKRLKLKQEVNGDKDGDDDDEEEGGEYQLANFEPEQERSSGSDDGESDGDSSDEDVAPRRNNYNSDDSGSSSSGAESDSDDEPSATNRYKKPAAAKRKRDTSDSSGGSDSEESTGSAEHFRQTQAAKAKSGTKKNKQSSIAEQEALVLAMMNKKK